MTGRRLLGLVMVVALLAFLPASALAGSGSALRHHSPAAAGFLAYDSTTEDDAAADLLTPVDEPPADSAPAPREPEPSEPATAPTEPAPTEPTPTDPAPTDPVPTDPVPTDPVPTDPAPTEPAPTEPVPAPTDPAPTDPAPTDPAPAPAEPAPSNPVPPSEEWVPIQPAPRDERAPPVVKPPSDERLVSTPTVPVSTAAPVAAIPVTEPDHSATTPEPSRSGDDDDAKSEEKAVRVALKRLGIGTIAAPARADVATEDAPAAPAPSCTPIGIVDVVPASETVDGVAVESVVRPHRAGGEPPLVRGPPAPLESPSAPFAAAGSASAATGGASGERDCGILADQIVLTLVDAGSAVATDRSVHAAPAPANAAARAPPVA